MQLIKIDNTTIGAEVKETVNARDLHSFLESKQQFSDWIKNQIIRARLIENRDYVTIHKKVERQILVDYHLTIEAGKSIGMMSATDKGFEIRDYFLDCERRAKSPVNLLNDPAAMRTLLLNYTEKVLELEETVSTLAPKAAALDSLENADGYFNFMTAAKSLNIPPQKFINDLNRRGWIYRMGVTGSWTAHQEQINNGRMTHKIYRQELPDGTEKARAQALITPKGMAKLSQIYLDGI